MLLHCVSRRLVISEEWQQTEDSFSRKSSTSSSKYVWVAADFPKELSVLSTCISPTNFWLREGFWTGMKIPQQPSATGRSPRSGSSLLPWCFSPGWTGFQLEQLGRCKTPPRTLDLASAATKGRHPKHIFKMN